MDGCAHCQQRLYKKQARCLLSLLGRITLKWDKSFWFFFRGSHYYGGCIFFFIHHCLTYAPNSDREHTQYTTQRHQTENSPGIRNWHPIPHWFCQIIQGSNHKQCRKNSQCPHPKEVAWHCPLPTIYYSIYTTHIVLFNLLRCRSLQLHRLNASRFTLGYFHYILIYFSQLFIRRVVCVNRCSQIGT